MDMAAQGETSAWADFDGDGDLDLLTPNYDGGALWRNDGGDAFTDVLAASGITMDVTTGTDSCIGGGTTRPEGVTWLDLDGDGWLDLYVAGRLWQSRGDGTFAEASGTGDLRVGNHDESVAPADIDADNDGDLDLFVPDYYPPYFNTWYRNDGDWSFEQVSDWLTDPSGGSGRWNGAIGSFGDYDEDGDLDLALWRYDQPSDPLVQVRVLRNDLDPAGGWMRVRVLDEAGHPTQPGALVRLADGSRVQTRYVDGGTDWAVDAYDVHFGVDDETSYELEVSFPRRSGEDPRVLGPSDTPCLQIVPGALGDRTVERKGEGGEGVRQCVMRLWMNTENSADGWARTM